MASLVAVLSLGDGMERTTREPLAQTTDLQTIIVDPRLAEEIEGQSFPMADTLAMGSSDLTALRVAARLVAR